jgi:RNA polymerase sigma-70 factor, ECF subfamily
MDPDLALLERWRGGDEQAGQALFARHFANIYRFFDNKIGFDAEDLTQRTFLACVAAGRAQFRAQSSFRTYLFTIARHELYAHVRREARAEQVDFETRSFAEIVTSVASRLDRQRRHSQLHEALAELPAEQQVLLEMHYWDGLDAAALGEVFDANPGAIRVRLLRARKALRARLAARGPGALANASTDALSTALSAPETDDEPGDPDDSSRS